MSIRYKIPNFEAEWGEAERYPFFARRGINKWVEFAKGGKPVRVTAKHVAGIANTDAGNPSVFESLAEDKRERFAKCMESGEVEMPIVMINTEGKLELVAGNTRLTGLMKLGEDAQVWLVDARPMREIPTSKTGMDVGSNEWFRFMMNRFS